MNHRSFHAQFVNDVCKHINDYGNLEKKAKILVMMIEEKRTMIICHICNNSEIYLPKDLLNPSCNIGICDGCNLLICGGCWNEHKCIT